MDMERMSRIEMNAWGGHSKKNLNSLCEWKNVYKLYFSYKQSSY